ncbi:hypothetical protein DAEQUDRAFT_719432 [Daedalea quercina L-15889]|uniref:F-box domain-containing protein n=1 Tax=Daedalea quercina L-15889 TaxID=1314783 RepID=A0A165KPU8_9APHY|nr:hypothetical protein DAEQUDRAFT_719432 [Daedalea quercina L-15889]
MLPVLPVEIWERVIDSLRNWPAALVACSSVCKTWNARSRFHLITWVRLTDRQRTHWLTRFLRENPPLRPRVHSVSIRSSLRRGTRQPIPHFGTFALMLPGKLPAAKALYILDAEWHHGAMHPDTFLHLSTFLSITDLRLRDVSLPSKLVLARLICALPNLAELECVNVVVQSKTFHPFVFHSTPPQIKAIWLDGPSNDIVDLLAVQLGIATSVETFTAGCSVHAEDSPSNGAIMSMLRYAGPTVKDVDIRLRQLPKVLVLEQEGSKATGAATYYSIDPDLPP